MLPVPAVRRSLISACWSLQKSGLCFTVSLFNKVRRCACECTKLRTDKAGVACWYLRASEQHLYRQSDHTPESYKSLGLCAGPCEHRNSDLTMSLITHQRQEPASPQTTETEIIHHDLSIALHHAKHFQLNRVQLCTRKVAGNRIRHQHHRHFSIMLAKQ